MSYINNYDCNSNNCNQNGCTDNASFWYLIYNLQKTRNVKNLNLTPKQRFALCNYMNGRLYDRKALKPFLTKPKKN